MFWQKSYRVEAEVQIWHCLTIFLHIEHSTLTENWEKCRTNENWNTEIPHTWFILLLGFVYWTKKTTAKSRTTTKMCYTVSSKEFGEKASIGNGKQYIDIFLCCFSLHFFWGGRNLGLGKIVIFCTIWQESGVICWR